MHGVFLMYADGGIMNRILMIKDDILSIEEEIPPCLIYLYMGRFLTAIPHHGKVYANMTLKYTGNVTGNWHINHFSSFNTYRIVHYE